MAGCIRIISLACFANNVIYLWPQMMPIFLTQKCLLDSHRSDSFLRRNFLYISTLENRGDKSVNQNFQNIVLDTWDSHANFPEKLS